MNFFLARLKGTKCRIAVFNKLRMRMGYLDRDVPVIFFFIQRGNDVIT